MPEGYYPLAEATIYLATAPKSNSVKTAYAAAVQDAQATLAEPVPLHLRNPVTNTMKELGYGRDYKYDHSFPEHHSGQQHLPDALHGRRITCLGSWVRGADKRMAERLRVRSDGPH
jgi:putative ATPase